MPPAHPDTTMSKAEQLTENFTVFTADQQLYRCNRGPVGYFLRLGGMSFVEH